MLANNIIQLKTYNNYTSKLLFGIIAPHSLQHPRTAENLRAHRWIFANLVPMQISCGWSRRRDIAKCICTTWPAVRNVTGEASAHAQHKFGAVKVDLLWYDFATYNKLTTWLRNIRLSLYTDKFRCFHQTKQTQNEVERFFLQLGRICFRILLGQSENFSDFCKVLSQFAFRNMIMLFYTSSSAGALKLPSPKKFLQIPPPSPNLLSPNLAKTLLVLAPDILLFVRRLGDLVSAKKNCEQGEGFVKFCCVKKACVWDGGETEYALDDVFGI